MGENVKYVMLVKLLIVSLEIEHKLVSCGYTRVLGVSTSQNLLIHEYTLFFELVIIFGFSA